MVPVPPGLARAGPLRGVQGLLRADLRAAGPVAAVGAGELPLRTPADLGRYPAVLITGGKGQLGRELERLLVERGAPVYAPGRDELDVTDSARIERVIDGGSPASVFHAAGWTGGGGCQPVGGGEGEVDAD